MAIKTVKRFQYYYDLPANVRKIADSQDSPFVFFHHDNDRVTRGYLVATGGDFFNVISHFTGFMIWATAAPIITVTIAANTISFFIGKFD